MKVLFRYIKSTLAVLLLLGLLIYLVFGYRDLSVDYLKEKYFDSTSAFIEVNGLNVHYRDQGSSQDSIPIVLIHGTGASLHTFDAWTQELTKTHRVIRMDLPAYGLTGPTSDRNYSIDSYINFIKDFLVALKINKCILAGNSLGGSIAWNFCLQHADKADKLILINASGFPTHSESVPIAFRLATVPVLNKIMHYITPKFMVRSSVENVYSDPSKVSETIVDRYHELSLREGNRQAFVDRLKTISSENNHKNINTIQHPTLILWGIDDRLIPVENAYKFEEALPQDTLVILKNTGHTPMEENPDESIKAVLDFLKNSIQ